MLSLNARLLIAASVVLVAFLGLTGFTLDKAFRQSALAAVRDRLQTQIYGLLGAADVDATNDLELPLALPEARFSTPASGLYGQVTDGSGGSVWRSPSLLGLRVPFPQGQQPGTSQFSEIRASDGQAFFAMAFAVTWELEPGKERRYTFQVAETRNQFAGQVAGFRRSLWGWLAGAALVLLAVQGVILRWSLAPLRQVAREIAEIESGRGSLLTGRYPKELRHLTDNLNALIESGRTRLERYRNALGDLAHSLKTPLAVLRGTVEGEPGPQELKEVVEEQVDRMDQTVHYQLQRAAASGRTALTAPLPVAPIVRKVTSSLTKVYADKAVQLQLAVDAEARFRGDQGDLMEILGNLADNAWKWSHGRVTLRAHGADEDSGTPPGLVMEVEDDGPGIPHGKADEILGRGVRADPHTEGHGIGLAVVRELVEQVYGGNLHIDRSPLGGARVRVTLPN